MDLLDRIKGLVARGRMRFAPKAVDEMERDGLSRDDDGVPVYTKGVIRREEATEYFYVLISAKRWARDADR